MNEREQFWAGEFGDEYNRRSPGNIEANKHFFQRALQATKHIDVGGDPQIVELGCGMGANLCALNAIYYRYSLTGVELNSLAAQHCASLPFAPSIFQSSILDWKTSATWDLAFTKGVLIHIHPDDLAKAYYKLYSASRRYIIVAEYYSPKPVEVPYRGHAGRLWKRDFAGELLDIYGDLRLIDYGFVYHRDELAPQDDINWFLLEKRGDHGEGATRTAA